MESANMDEARAQFAVGGAGAALVGMLIHKTIISMFLSK